MTFLLFSECVTVIGSELSRWAKEVGGQSLYSFFHIVPLYLSREIHCDCLRCSGMVKHSPQGGMDVGWWRLGIFFLKVQAGSICL